MKTRVIQNGPEEPAETSAARPPARLAAAQRRRATVHQTPDEGASAMEAVEIYAPPRHTDAGATVVSAHDLTRQYGAGETAVHALRGVSVEVASGGLPVGWGPPGPGRGR